MAVWGGGSVGSVEGGYLGGTMLGLGIVRREGGRDGGFVRNRRECEVCGRMQSAANLSPGALSPGLGPLRGT